jgi:hypothetical protein
VWDQEVTHRRLANGRIQTYVAETHGLMNNFIHLRMRFREHERIAAVFARVEHFTIIFIMSLVLGQPTSTDITGIAKLFACEMSFCSKCGGNPMRGHHFYTQIL